MLILSRSAQGIGGAILFATSLALLAHSFHGHERGVAFGIWGAVTGVAVGLGPVLGGVITTGISWRGIFLVNLPVGVAALVVTGGEVDESKTPHAARPDWAGFATLTAGLVSLVYGLIRAGEIAWGDTGVVICLALAVVFLVVVRGGGAPSRPSAVRPLAVPDSHLWRGSGRRVRHERLALRDALVPRPLPAGRPRLLRPATGLRLLVMSGVTLSPRRSPGDSATHMPVRWLIGPGPVAGRDRSAAHDRARRQQHRGPT